MKDKIIILTLGIFIFFSLVNLNSALIVDSVSANPNEISPGETSVIKIGLDNNGENDIIDITIKLDLSGVISIPGSTPIVFDMPFAPYNSASEFNIDEIKDSKVKYADFEIIALNNAKSGIYKIPVEISYKENDLPITKTSLISITINSEPIISANLEDSLLLQNQENELSIRITNKGLGDAKFLEIELGDSVYFKKLSSENVYIGDINSDDFDTAKFKVYFENNAPGMINIPVIIKYKNSLNKEYTENSNVQSNIYNQEEAIKLGLLKKNSTSKIFIGIISFIALYLIYRKLKKRKNKY